MLLNVNEIHTYYGRTRILDGLSIEVDRGETVALLGRNGFGKSTTLKSIMGMPSPRMGSILFKDSEIVGLKPHQICQCGIGFVPQERRIFPYLTVRQNLIVGMQSKQNIEDPWTIEKIYSYFPVLAKRDRQKGGLLSGGEQQMLTIGRTLMGNPELLLVDEPTEGLAPVVTEEVIHMIQFMQERSYAILLVEHIMDVALRLAGRVYVMSKGGIVFEGTKDEFDANENIRKKFLEV